MTGYAVREGEVICCDLDIWFWSTRTSWDIYWHILSASRWTSHIIWPTGWLLKHVNEAFRFKYMQNVIFSQYAFRHKKTPIFLYMDTNNQHKRLIRIQMCHINTIRGCWLDRVHIERHFILTEKGDLCSLSFWTIFILVFLVP